MACVWKSPPPSCKAWPAATSGNAPTCIASAMAPAWNGERSISTFRLRDCSPAASETRRGWRRWKVYVLGQNMPKKFLQHTTTEKRLDLQESLRLRSRSPRAANNTLESTSNFIVVLATINESNY